MKRHFFSCILSLFLCVTCLLSLISCGNGFGNGASSDSSSDTSLTLKAPVITPTAGDYTEGFKTITIANSNKSGDIFYTTDGKEPTSEDSRYTGEFKIIGSKTIKAIVINGSSQSPVTTAKFVLNVGKTQSQLGVVTGKVTLSPSLSEADRTKLTDSTIYIYSDEIPGVVKTCKIGESYYFDGLDTSKNYSFFFSNVEPVIVQNSRNTARTASPKNQGTERDENGMPLVAKKVQVTPEEGAGIEVPVDLSATGKIKGIVKRFDLKGDEEADHAGTVVYIPGTSYSAYTDKDGNFVISGVPQGSHTIRVQYAGYSFVEKEDVILEAKDENIPETVIEDVFNLAFGKGIVKGTVLLSDATDISSLSGITVVITDSTNNYSYTASTTTSGSYTITDVYPGTYSAQISKEGYEEALITEISIVGSKITTIPTTSLQVIGGSLSGSVSINGKTDLSGIAILAESDSGKSFFAITNSKGAFSWEKVAPGTYTIFASYAGYKTSVITGIVVSIGGTVENLILPEMEKATYSITGKVILEGIESGFEGTAILIKKSNTLESVANTITGTDGTFTVSNIQPGDYVLTITRTGYLTDNGVTVSVGATPISIVNDIVLKNAAGTVAGTVTMESAADNAGITILVISTTDSDTSYNTVTDSNGHYSIGGIAPGSYKVQATKSGYNNGYSDAFTITAGTKTEVNDILLNISQRSLFGIVKLEGKSDFAGIKITATNVNKPSNIYSALSNSNGIYVLTGMTPGEYILTYSYESYVTYTGASISLESDSSKEVSEIELKKATGKIIGIVNLEGCSDHSGVTVSLVGTDKTYITESDGSYEFTVPSGNYAGGVRFSREDFQLTAKADTITVLTDSTYGVLTVEMKAIANTVKGTVDLAGNDDDSGITVTIDEYPELTAAITDTDGKWALAHVPVDSKKIVTIRFSRVNTPDVTSQIKVIANDYVDLGLIEMIPNSATLKGHVYLTNMTDHSGITVTVKTDEKEDLTVRTTSDGTFEVTNILATGSHDVIFSKEGWDSQTLTINDFIPMEERELADSINLVDTSAPVLKSVIIEDGVNFTNSSKLNIKLDVAELGSGIEKMAVQIKAPEYENLYPSVLDWQDYKIAFTKDLSEMPSQVYTGNGEYTVYVTLKDVAGNESSTVFDSITVTNQVSILRGVLSGSDLHLTKTKSPYRVESNILCQEGDTLIIDPGVEIRFAGNYYLKVDGCIKAIGTEEEKILFTSDSVEYSWEEWIEYDEFGNYVGNYITKYETRNEKWNSVNVGPNTPLILDESHNYVSGNCFSYCAFENAYNPLYSKGHFFSNSCNFAANNDEVIISNVNVYEGKANNVQVYLLNSKVDCNFTVTYDNYYSDKYINIINNKFTSTVSFRGAYNDCYTDNWPIFKQNTLQDCDLVIGNSAKFERNIFNNVRISFTGEDCSQGVMNYNNFIDCNGILVDVSSLSALKHKTVDYRHNYWGVSQTEELNLKGNKTNISFIYDYYDDFDRTRVDYSEWMNTPIEAAGYKGDAFDLSTLSTE